MVAEQNETIDTESDTNFDDLSVEEYHNETVIAVGDALEDQMQEHDHHRGSRDVFNLIKYDIAENNKQIATLTVKPNPNFDSEASPYTCSFFMTGEEEVAVLCQPFEQPDEAFLGHHSEAVGAIEMILSNPVAVRVELDGKDWFLDEIDA